MSNIILPPINPILSTKIQPKLMKDTYKKVHIYLFDFDVVLGKGSFSKVYKGINLNTNEQVAVKVIQMGSINTPKLKQLLLQQIDILMKVKHENLIKCFEVLSSSKNTYIIMQLCTQDFGTVCQYIQKQQQKQKRTFLENQNNKFLHERLNQQDIFHLNHRDNNNVSSKNHHFKQQSQSQSLSKSIDSISSTKSVEFKDEQEEFKVSQNSGFFDRAIQQKREILKQQKFYPFIKQIFLALQYLSTQKIVHRDLKLSNIFLVNDTTCKIGDFGFATIIPQKQYDIKDTCCIGSPLYMSPQSYLQNVYSLKSDIWSFGILIFQMIYGNPPHWNCPTHQILKSQVKKPINLSKFEKLAKISDQMKQVLQGCLKIQVRNRFSISQLKQTKLFKRLLFEPLQSDVIINKRNIQKIQESSVQVFRRSGQDRQSSNNDFQDNRTESQYSNYSCIKKVKQGFKQINFLNFGNQSYLNNKSSQQRRCSKMQTFNQNINLSDGLMTNNNSFTQRGFSIQSIKNGTKARTSSKIGTNQQISNNKTQLNKKFMTTDLNGNIFKQVNKLNENKKHLKLQHNNKQNQTQFSYKNSDNMQKYLKQLKQGKLQSYKFDLQKQITFTDLSNINSPKNRNKYESRRQEEKQSPKFASTFNGPFFNKSNFATNQSSFNQISKKSRNQDMLQNLSFCNNNSHSRKTQDNQTKNTKQTDLLSRNRSCMLDKKAFDFEINMNNNRFKDLNPNYTTNQSPRCQSSYDSKTRNNFDSIDANKDKPRNINLERQKNQVKVSNQLSFNNKQNINNRLDINNSDDSLLRKNYSTGNFSSYQSKQLPHATTTGYQYKTKLLQKCTSSPKFQSLRTDKSHQHFSRNDIDHQFKHMTTSSFYGTSAYSPKNKINFQQEPSTKKTDKKQDLFMKTFEGSNNFLNQFSNKIKQKPSNIQKKTYFKSGTKNFQLNLADRANQSKQSTAETKQYSQTISLVNTDRNMSFLYATSTQQTGKQQRSFNQSKQKSYFSKQNQVPTKQHNSSKQKQNIKQINNYLQSFKLLNGQIIVKDACQLIHFSRILHKLSFSTQNNYNSINLLQYGIQILNNLLQKCQNFEIRYHYDNSTNNSAQIRQAFKLNDIYLNSLSMIHQKQCYAVKKELGKQNTQSICNKTNQLKGILQSYVKKFIMRKQALIKLFECNLLFQNLTNKVKQAKYSSTSPKSLSKQPSLMRRQSLNSQKGYLNFTKLQNIFSQIQLELKNKKGTSNNSSSQSSGTKILIYMSNLMIESIVKCVRDRSFKELSQNMRAFQKYKNKSDGTENCINSLMMHRADKQLLNNIFMNNILQNGTNGTHRQETIKSLMEKVLETTVQDQKRSSYSKENGNKVQYDRKLLVL